MIYPAWRGRVKRGQIELERRADYRMFLCRLEGQEIELVVRKPARENTKPQQRYYRAVICKLLGEYFGYTVEEMHGALALRFFVVEDERTGLKRVRSTALGNWTTVEWEEKMEEIRRWASVEHGVYIPLPNEADWI